jgi:hypothetical protein
MLMLSRTRIAGRSEMMNTTDEVTEGGSACDESKDLVESGRISLRVLASWAARRTNRLAEIAVGVRGQ